MNQTVENLFNNLRHLKNNKKYNELALLLESHSSYSTDELIIIITEIFDVKSKIKNSNLYINNILSTLKKRDIDKFELKILKSLFN